MKYTTNSGIILEGSLAKVSEALILLGEYFDFSKAEGIDETKYYFSSSRQELTKISDMNTVHIMNAITKKIRNYFNGLKLDKEIEIPSFFKKLETWTEEKEIKNLVAELLNRTPKLK